MANDNEILNAGNGATEVWKPIPGYEGIYEASSLGRVKSLPRLVYAKDGRKPRVYNERILRPFPDKKGYLYIILCNDAAEHQRYIVHRLIAQVFIPNDNINKTDVDHINGEKADNRVVNLRWVTPKENSANPITKARQESKVCRAVIRLDKNNCIKEYEHLSDVKADGFNVPCVCACCSGEKGFHRGYVWIYKGETIHDYDYYVRAKAERIRKGNEKHRRPLVAFNNTNTMEFATQREAANKGFDGRAIIRCIKNGKTHKGYYWRYKNG